MRPSGQKFYRLLTILAANLDEALTWAVHDGAMKRRILLCIICLRAGLGQVPGHEDLGGFDREALRAHVLAEWKAEQAGKAQAAAGIKLAAADAPTARQAARALKDAPPAARVFMGFPQLEVRWDADVLRVGSTGWPDHPMMKGITSWQQQVPLPQPYTGDNAWTLPLRPVPAATPAMLDDRFLRGAVALAANGIPIFNPRNNRGEMSVEIGELDEWGGHCGRADDYHYHVAPLHLQKVLGRGMPVAVALDGYAIYGPEEPDGTPAQNLDVCHGHDSPTLGYHYHASSRRPYVMAGFHGRVVELDGQVDPQPRARPVREALPGLRGAEITGFETLKNGTYDLRYTVNGEARGVQYTLAGPDRYEFVFNNGRDGVVRETYEARGEGRGEGRGGPPKKAGGGKGGMSRPRPGEGETRPMETEMPPPPPGRADHDDLLDLNADGEVSAQEYAAHARERARRSAVPVEQELQRAREEFQRMDLNRSGKLEAKEWNSAAAPTERPTREGGQTPKGGPVRERPSEPRAPRAAEAPGAPAGIVRSSNGTLLLTSPDVEDGGNLPAEHTGEGAGTSPPLAWQGTPAGTQAFAVVMDHQDKDGAMKCSWILYNLPAEMSALPAGVKDVGVAGASFKGAPGYEPPNSRGPGAKTYVVTLYALSAPVPTAAVRQPLGRDMLLAAMEGKVLATSSLRVVHDSQGQPEGMPRERERQEPAMKPGEPAARKGGGLGRPKGKPGGGQSGPSGLIKPTLDDTLKLNVYADNWFMLYINGRLAAVDSIPFTPHNVVSVDILPEYPMTIAVLAKDNADAKTGLEYGTQIGDGGFILKFADGTVTDARWKARSFFHGPLRGDSSRPEVRQEPLPENWWAVDFDDSQWPNAKEYTEEQVDPKQPYYDNDFSGAKFIWTEDLALDNTVIFRTRVDKPGWTPRWNTRPDLDVTGAPLR